MLPIYFLKIKPSVLFFCPSFKSKTKHLSFLTFSWDKKRCKLKATTFLEEMPPPQASLGADRSFIIGTEMV
jgi:hypothetical protein